MLRTLAKYVNLMFGGGLGVNSHFYIASLISLPRLAPLFSAAGGCPI